MRQMLAPAGPVDAPQRSARWLAAGLLAGAVLALHAWLLTRWPGAVVVAPEAARAVDLVLPQAAARDGAPADATAGEPVPERLLRPPRAVAPTAARRLPAPAAATTPPAQPSDINAAALGPPPPEDAPMPVQAPPVYATQPPPAARLRFALRRGEASGQAELDWRPDGERYVLQLQATLPQGATLDQRSEGGFDAAGLAPLRLAERRRGRAAQAANFQRTQQRITFSGPRWEHPLVPGVQDRLSWLVQLAAIAAAAPLQRGDELALQVVGARGATARWRFRVDGSGDLDTDAGRRHAVRLVREPEHLYDLRIELWLDAGDAYWPLRLRQQQVPGGEALEWTRIGVDSAGPTPRPPGP